MITTTSTEERFRTIVTNGQRELDADPPRDKGGTGSGFGAHELLEAAFAACMNMAIRMRAVADGIPVPNVRTAVRLVRPNSEQVMFEYHVELSGDLSDEQRAALMQAADACPVRQTLSRQLRFERVTDAHTP